MKQPARITWIVQQLLKLPSNPVLDRLIVELIKDYSTIDSLRSRFGWQMKLRPCSDPELLRVRSSAALGRYERSYLKLLIQLVKQGDAVVDVGAFEGYFTIPLAKKVGEEGHVFSIEPDPANVEILQKNIQLNQLTNVTVMPKAISDHHGVMMFHGDRAWGTLINCHILGPDQTVDVDVIDNIIPENFKPPLTLIEIDVEGNEIRVIRGAKNIILSKRPIVSFEVNLTLLAYVDISMNEVFNFFRKNEYRLFKESHGKLRSFDWLNERVCNMLAIPAERLSTDSIKSALES